MLARTRAIDDPRLDRYELTKDSEDGPSCFAKSVERCAFRCRICGQSYESVWVGRHETNPMCPACIAVARAGMGANGIAKPCYPMPPLYAQDGSSIMSEVKAWVHGPRHSLVLTGGPGRGKTCQAHHAAAEATTRGLRPIVIGDRDLVMPDKGEMSLWGSTGFLVVDEIGKRSSPTTLANLCDLIDTRIAANRKTIMVTNLSGADVQAMDARLASRMRAAGVIRFDGPDLRRREHMGEK